MNSSSGPDASASTTSGAPLESAPVGSALSASDFALLQDAQLALSPALSLEDALRAILSRLMQATGAMGGAIWVCRREIPSRLTSGPEDQCDAWLCLNASLPEQTSFLIPQELHELEASVLQSGNLQQALFDGAPEQPQRLDVALPLQTEDETIGILRLRYEYAHQDTATRDTATRDTATSHTINNVQPEHPNAPRPDAPRPDAPRLDAPHLDARRRTLLGILVRHAAAAIASARFFQQLQNAKREWEVTFDGMLDGVCIERSDGVILRANRALATMVGLSIEEILSSKREDLYARLPEYQLLRPLQRVPSDTSGLNVRNGEFRFGSPERIIAETVFTLRFPDRRRRARASRVLDSDEGHSVCVLRDITEQRRLQEQLVQSEKLAALGELVSGVAHELNNPLTTVVGYAQLLQDDANLSESARRQMGVIHTEAARAARIVQNLLAFARREEPRKTRLDINDVLRSVAAARTLPLQAQGTRITAHYAYEPPTLWGDPHQLQQVFLNVINNAHQAIQEWRGEGEVHLQTQVTTVAGTRGVRIIITDNGPGIAPEHLRRIFDPFFTTKQLGEGTGLGMSISLGIISNHNGRIWAESTLGHGARFIVELPAIDVDSDAEDEEETPVEAQEPVSEPVAEEPAYRILVVDDEEPVVMLITEILHLDGHRITPAFNGAEALALLQEQEFDFILSDVRMPAVGGPTFFEILQTIRPDLLPRVMFVTGDTVSPSTQEFLRRAGRPMLTKPFDPERLRAMVNDHLKQIAAQEATAQEETTQDATGQDATGQDAADDGN
ncbi:MAG TPA: ATP-binding protein [Abditibacteriaceae bacterium]